MAMPIQSPGIAAPRYTVDEIESWPDDGNRYELLDGVLLVTPSPGPTHQLVATEIAHVLAGLLEPWPHLRVSAPRRPAYPALGVAEMWRVDCDERVIFVSRPGEPPDRAYRDVLPWAPPGVGATLALSLDRVFRGIEP